MPTLSPRKRRKQHQQHEKEAARRAAMASAVIGGSLGAAGAVLFERSHASALDLPTVPSVDLKRYAGLWHEIARLPVRFQLADSVATAEYSLNDDGTVQVHNTAYIGTRQVDAITGKAVSVDPGVNSRLSVSFGGITRLFARPHRGNYWVLGLDDEYTLALVGTPDRSKLWLLARDPDAYGSPGANELLQHAVSLGFDTSKLLVADWDKRHIRRRT